MASNRHRPTIPVPTKGATDGFGDSDPSMDDASTVGDDEEVPSGAPRSQETEAMLLIAITQTSLAATNKGRSYARGPDWKAGDVEIETLPSEFSPTTSL